MRLFHLRHLTLIWAIIASIAFTSSCNNDYGPDRNVYYAYYTFSDDMLDLFDITVSIIDADFNTLVEQNFNTATPYEYDTENMNKSFLIKCNAKDRYNVLLLCSMKAKSTYDELLVSGRLYELRYGHYIHRMQNNETDEEATQMVKSSCKIKSMEISSDVLSTYDRKYGMTKRGKIMEELEHELSLDSSFNQ